MAEIHAARRGRAQEKIAEIAADAALITSGPNVRYLTGLASSNAALLLPASGTGILATDARYAPAAQRDCSDLELIVERFIEPRLASQMTSRGWRTVAFEAHEMTVERHAELVAKAPDVNAVPFGRKIEELRMVKDPSELELLATACRISCQAIADVFALIRPGVTERQLAAALDRRMTDVGDVDAAARDLIRDAGHGEHFVHGLGHGIGLEVQEAPAIGYSRTGKLASRVPVTVEPGVYLPGRGGVRIEDVLVVGAGGTGLLTTTTRELLVL